MSTNPTPIFPTGPEPVSNSEPVTGPESAPNSKDEESSEHFSSGDPTQKDTQKDGEKDGENSESTILSRRPPMEIYAESTEDIAVESDTGIPVEGRMLPTGTVFGHYVITKYIGGGGMGRVYLGIDQALDRRVAIKVLPHQRARDQGSVARFMNEARSAARLNHEHIAQVYFAGEHEGIPFIAFEYVEGTNIRTLVEEKGPLPLSQAVNYLLQITQALAHASIHKVIHRDVKPSNIIITKEGRAKLIDMGLARLLSPTTAENDLTASGVTLGTFDYISPEQARDPRNADARSDIYSLGCTFFFMLTGRPPFSEGTVLQKLLQHQGDIPPDVRDYQPNIPEKVAQVIQKMMAKEPKYRFQTASELVEAFLEIAEMIGLRPLDPSRISWGNNSSPRKRLLAQTLPWLIPGTLLLIAVLVIHFYWLSKSGIGIDPQFPDPLSSIKLPDREGSFSSEKTSDDLTPQTSSLDPQNPPRNIPSYPLFTYQDISEPRFLDENAAMLAICDRTGGKISPQLNANWGPELFFTKISLKKEDGFVPTLEMAKKQIISSEMKEKTTAPTSTRRILFDPLGQVEGAYSSFTSVMKAAEKDATIVLCASYNYPMDPIDLSGCNYRFVAAEGKSPILLFRPSEPKNSSMITLSESKLRFENVDLELIVPQFPASQWTLFNMVGQSSLEFEHSALTIINVTSDLTTYHENAAFFRSSPRPIGPGSGTTSLVTTSPTSTSQVTTSQTSTSQHPSPSATSTSITSTISTPSISISLKNSIVRGEAVVLKSDSSRAAQLDFNNVFVATSRPVFSLQDTKDVTNKVAVKMKDTTIFAQLLVYWQRGSNISGMNGQPFHLTLTDSLIRVAKESTLAEYAGEIPDPKISELIFVQNDHSYFQNISRLCTIKSATSGEISRTEFFPENLPKPDSERAADAKITWMSTQFESKPAHRITPLDMVLSGDRRSNPAIQSSEDRQSDGKQKDAGAVVSRLPTK